MKQQFIDYMDSKYDKDQLPPINNCWSIGGMNYVRVLDNKIRVSHIDFSTIPHTETIEHVAFKDGISAIKKIDTEFSQVKSNDLKKYSLFDFFLGAIAVCGLVYEFVWGF